MTGAALLAASSMIVGGAAIAQRERLPAECRQQIIDLCRGAEGGIRQCLMTALPKLSDDCRKTIANRAAAKESAVTGMREVAYGSDPLQKFDVAVPAGAKRAPLLLFIHGGGWSIGDKRAGESVKAPHFTSLGWAFASINYRLVPQATVEQQAGDLASAIAYARAHAAELGLDPNRIVLMGHSAGAHLAALVGTDPRYLEAAGMPIKAVRGIILLDGAGYDIGKQMARLGNPVAPMYDAAFGKDPARQAALSPTLHAAAPTVADWLILPIEKRPDSMEQSQGLAAALGKAGAHAKVVPVFDKTHGSLNKELGESGDFATGEVDRFLATTR